MEKGRSVATKRRLETDKCLRCSLWMFSGIAISLMVILLGFTIWTLVSYQNTVTALQSRVDKLEVDLDLIRSGKEALIAKTVEEEVSKVKFPNDLSYIQILNFIQKSWKNGILFEVYIRYLIRGSEADEQTEISPIIDGDTSR